MQRVPTHHAPPAAHLRSLFGSTSVTVTGTVTVPVLTAAATADRRELHRGREGEEGEVTRLGVNFAAKNWLFKLYTGGSREGIPLRRVATDVKGYVLSFHSGWGARTEEPKWIS